MSLVLGAEEQVYYPQPYLPGEPAALLITNQRVVRITDLGMAEFPVRDIDYVGRSTRRPALLPGIVLIAAAIGAVVIGSYAAVTTPGPINKLFQKTEPTIQQIDLPPLPVPGAKPTPKPAATPQPQIDEDDEGTEDDKAPDGEDDLARSDSKPAGGHKDALLGQIGGLITVGAGLVVLLLGAWLVRRRAYQVSFRIHERLVWLDAADGRDQTVILATLGSASSAARASATAAEQQAAALKAASASPSKPAPARASEVEEVDDGGNPVRALQELKAQKDAGKIDAATFERRRAALLRKL